MPAGAFLLGLGTGEAGLLGQGLPATRGAFAGGATGRRLCLGRAAPVPAGCAARPASGGAGSIAGLWASASDIPSVANANAAATTPVTAQRHRRIVVVTDPPPSHPTDRLSLLPPTPLRLAFILSRTATGGKR